MVFGVHVQNDQGQVSKCQLQLKLSNHILESILDEECVEPEEEGTVVIADRDAFGRASEHELDILVHEGRLDQGHLKSVSLKLVDLSQESESQKSGLPSSHN